MAQPPFKPTAEHRQLVLKMSGIGCTQEENLLCIPWGTPDGKPISPKTLRAHFGDEIERGHAQDAVRVRQSLRDLIDAGNVAAIIFHCKTRLGMKESLRVEATGADGQPLPAPVMAQFYLPCKDVLPPLAPNLYEVPYRPPPPPPLPPLEPIQPQHTASAAQRQPEPAAAPPAAAGNARPSGRFYPPSAALHVRR